MPRSPTPIDNRHIIRPRTEKEMKAFWLNAAVHLCQYYIVRVQTCIPWPPVPFLAEVQFMWSLLSPGGNGQDLGGEWQARFTLCQIVWGKTGWLQLLCRRNHHMRKCPTLRTSQLCGSRPSDQPDHCLQQQSGIQQKQENSMHAFLCIAYYCMTRYDQLVWADVAK